MNHWLKKREEKTKPVWGTITFTVQATGTTYGTTTIYSYAGSPGVSGPVGCTGNVGSVGDPGEPGDVGPIGCDGPDGPVGDPGDNWVDG